MEAHAPHGVERAQALHHIGLGLLHDIDVADDDDEHQYHQNGDGNRAGDRDVVEHTIFLLFLC